MSTDLLTERNKAYSEGIALGEKRGIALGERRGEKRGIALGERRGRQEGVLSAFVKMVKIGLIPIDKACEQLGITEKEFNKFLSMY